MDALHRRWGETLLEPTDSQRLCPHYFSVGVEWMAFHSDRQEKGG